MQNLKRVETSTQVGSEDINMSSRRERKSLTDSLCRVLEKVYEDEDIESMSDFEDDHYNSNVVYNEDDYEDDRKFEDDNYDSVAVYGEDNNEDDDDWKERSYEELEELINDSENPSERKESESSPH